MTNQKGFTLIELMVVITIIGILAAIAIPSFSVYRERAYLSEGLSLVKPVIRNIAEYYGHRGTMPNDNRDGGIAEPEALKGKYVQSIRIDKGIITILFNELAQSRSGGTITLFPQIDEDRASGVIRWRREDNFPKKPT